jgi:hypothetical protein
MISPPEKEWDGDLITHNLPPPVGLIECKTVLDVGAGIRPMNWYKPSHHICIEPYDRYVDRLRAAGYFVFQETALYALKRLDTFDAVYLLDVIEHMEKDEGLEVVSLAKEKAHQQVVIFTPWGFMEQEEDAWGLGGDYWQKHRSGWLPEDLPGFECYRYAKGFYGVFTA